MSGYSAEYDAAIDDVINKTSSWNNVSILFREYNMSENINLLHQGEIRLEIYYFHRYQHKHL